MRNFQDTFEIRKRSFIGVFFSLHEIDTLNSHQIHYFIALVTWLKT